jgi:hypothetical protein
VTPRSVTIRLGALFVCWLGYACTEAHGPRVAEQRDGAEDRGAGDGGDPPDSVSAPVDAAAFDQDGALGVCAAREFDPSERPDDDGPASRCRYRVLPGVVDPTYVRVMVGGRTRPLGHAPDGWTWDAETDTVTLLGTACDEARAGALVRIQNECAVVPSR